MSKLNLEQVGRVCVTVADTDRAIDFYVGTLGFTKVVDTPMGDDMRWVEVALPGRADEHRARAAPAGRRGGRQPDRHLPRHVGRRRRPRRPQGGRSGRRRRGHALGRAGAADVLAARPRRELADRRSAAGRVDVSGRRRRRTARRTSPRAAWRAGSAGCRRGRPPARPGRARPSAGRRRAPVVWTLAVRFVIVVSGPRGTTSGRMCRVCGATNVITIASSPQTSTGPPFERL